MYMQAEISVPVVLTLLLVLTFVLRNSCKVKENQQMQKDFCGKVSASEPVDPLTLTDWFSGLLRNASVLLLQAAEEQHGGHATDEEKLASSVGLAPNKDESCEYETHPWRLTLMLVCWLDKDKNECFCHYPV